MLTRRKLSTFLPIILTLIFAISFSSAIRAEQPEKAKQILENTMKKYEDLFKEDGNQLKSLSAKLSIKGGGSMDMGNSGKMPLEIAANLELYAKKPNSLFLGVSGNLGNVQIVIPEKKPLTATIILPVTKQFANLPISEGSFNKVKPGGNEKFWEENDLSYNGVESTKQGKAHIIGVKSKKNPESAYTVYILDRKWDPVKIEIKDKTSNAVIEFDELKFNTNIPSAKFVPNTKGYTQISKEQLTSLLMLQVMASTMQKN